MNRYYIEHENKKIYLTVGDSVGSKGFEVIFTKGSLSGEFSYKDNCISRSDVESFEEFEVHEETIEQGKDLTQLEHFRSIITSQIPSDDAKEVWTKIKTEEKVDSDDIQIIHLVNHKMIFFFDKTGRFKGILNTQE